MISSMTPIKRKPGRPSLSDQEKNDIRDNIIQIARELFLSEGYEHTSMRKIAAKAGFAPTKIYYYFDNKKEILRHFWSDISLDMWLHCQPSEALLSAEPLNIIRHIMDKSIQYWIANPKNYQLLVETQDLDAKKQDNFDFYNTPGTREYVQTLMNAVEACMDTDVFEKDSALFICQLITTSIFGVYGSFYSLPSIAWVDKERLISYSIENTLKGLQK